MGHPSRKGRQTYRNPLASGKGQRLPDAQLITVRLDIMRFDTMWLNTVRSNAPGPERIAAGAGHQATPGSPEPLGYEYVRTEHCAPEPLGYRYVFAKSRTPEPSGYRYACAKPRTPEPSGCRNGCASVKRPDRRPGSLSDRNNSCPSDTAPTFHSPCRRCRTVCGTLPPIRSCRAVTTQNTP
jgi:hypothetical protein